jgi:CBS domain-containing protein
MICPTCGWDNLPGNEECSNCQQDLTPLDRPVAQNRVERSLMEDRVSVLRPKAPVTVSPTTTVQQAIQVMLGHKLGALLVVDDGGKLVGVLSERDLLKKVAPLPDPYAELYVEDFMTPDPETVTAEDTLAFALHKMDVGGYRHLPVLSGGKPAGVISVRDMLRHITRLCKA